MPLSLSLEGDSNASGGNQYFGVLIGMLYIGKPLRLCSGYSHLLGGFHEEADEDLMRLANKVPFGMPR